MVHEFLGKCTFLASPWGNKTKECESSSAVTICKHLQPSKLSSKADLPGNKTCIFDHVVLKIKTVHT